ncbi:MAG: TIR domain-containing protein [Alphaproteobacteria bacterium]|nr:TIR domain-containing protein [Alphaproteobacteria bacterium]
MTRTVFFSFRYAHVFRVNQIRSMPNIIGAAGAGFSDSSLWESVKNDGPKIRGMIDTALKGTSVTVVCITYGVKDRKWIDYEINASLQKKNGLLGIQLHHLTDGINPDSRVGATPTQIEANGFKVYKYSNRENLARHIEEAARLADR